MKITETKARASKALDALGGRHETKKSDDRAANATPVSSESDTVELTGSSELLELTQLVGEKSEHSLEEIKAAIREGRYEVDYDRLADRLLADPGFLEG